MAIDWKKELNLIRRCWWWWMKVGFIAAPFGAVYGCVTVYLGHESLSVLIPLLVAALLTIYKIQGMPPIE
jgi:hypothetical protein